MPLEQVPGQQRGGLWLVQHAPGFRGEGSGRQAELPAGFLPFRSTLSALNDLADVVIRCIEFGKNLDAINGFRLARQIKEDHAERLLFVLQGVRQTAELLLLLNDCGRTPLNGPDTGGPDKAGHEQEENHQGETSQQNLQDVPV